MGAEARLRELGITLPPMPRPVANYVRAVRSGSLLFLAGHGPQRPGQPPVIGKVGRDLTVEQGAEAARLVGLNLLASARDALGSLDRVRRVVKVLGMVNATTDFGDHPRVVNGFSDLMVEVFGEAGRHARSAVGMSSLPFGISVEVEAILEVADTPVRPRPASARAAAPAPRRPAGTQVRGHAAKARPRRRRS